MAIGEASDSQYLAICVDYASSSVMAYLPLRARPALSEVLKRSANTFHSSVDEGPGKKAEPNTSTENREYSTASVSPRWSNQNQDNSFMRLQKNDAQSDHDEEMDG